MSEGSKVDGETIGVASSHAIGWCLLFRIHELWMKNWLGEISQQMLLFALFIHSFCGGLSKLTISFLKVHSRYCCLLTKIRNTGNPIMRNYLRCLSFPSKVLNDFSFTCLFVFCIPGTSVLPKGEVCLVIQTSHNFRRKCFWACVAIFASCIRIV